MHHIFHLKLERFNQHELERKREQELDQLSMISGPEGGTSALDASKGKGAVQQQQARHDDKQGRNEPCACGSGKKSKKCCQK